MTYVISDLNAEKNVGMFCKKKLQKTNQTEFESWKSNQEVEKVIKRKDERRQ